MSRPQGLPPPRKTKAVQGLSLHRIAHKPKNKHSTLKSQRQMSIIGDGAVILLCGRTLLLHRGRGCGDTLYPAFVSSAVLLYPLAAQIARGFSALFQERQCFARRSPSGPPFSTGRRSRRKSTRTKQQRPPPRGGLSPSLTAVVRASGGDVPVARSRSAVRPPSPIGAQGLAGYGVPVARRNQPTAPGYAGRPPHQRGASAGLMLFPCFWRFFVPEGKHNAKRLAVAWLGAFPEP